jgi:hypothetical protein
MSKKTASSSSVLKPGIAASLSTVPPVCPSPLPDILATVTPQAATMGTTISVVLSPTPPVECLSTFMPGKGDKSTISPERAIARVNATVSASVMPLKYTAIKKAEICSSGMVWSVTPLTKNWISSSVSAYPSRFFMINSTILMVSSCKLLGANKARY